MTPRSRRPVAGHGQLHRPAAWGQLLKMLGVVAIVVLVSGFSVAGYVVYDLGQTFSDEVVVLDGDDSVPPDIGAIKGGVNMLLVGSDVCEDDFKDGFGNRCSDPESGGERNDTNLLLHISDTPRRVTVITFPRDLMITIPSCTDSDGNASEERSKEALNQAIGIGGQKNGLACVARTITKVSGLDIQFAARVTWGGVMKITDAIGGVDVCVANGISDPENTQLELAPRTHTLQGYWALQFLRVRHGVGDNGDLSRGSNQQVYMSSLARKMTSSEVLGNPGTLLRLANTVMTNVTPSAKLTNPTLLVQIALAIKDVPLDQINFVNYPVLDDPGNPGVRVVPDYESADQLWAALAANQPIQVTGQRDAVVSATEAPADSPPDPSTGADASTTPTSDATGGPVALPQNISGQSAAQQTCSNGNGTGG